MTTNISVSSEKDIVFFGSKLRSYIILIFSFTYSWSTYFSILYNKITIVTLCKTEKLFDANCSLFYSIIQKWKLKCFKITDIFKILGIVKRNPLFFHSISCKNNRFLFTAPNINFG